LGKLAASGKLGRVQVTAAPELEDELEELLLEDELEELLDEALDVELLEELLVEVLPDEEELLPPDPPHATRPATTTAKQECFNKVFIDASNCCFDFDVTQNCVVSIFHLKQSRKRCVTEMHA
jgi:hypothetical protein